jgi:predicted dehydrogenase
VSVGVGVIGCGAIASAIHLPVLHRARGARIVAIADPDAGARARAAAIAPGARIEDDAAAVLDAPDVDALVVCARSDTHAEIALRAAALGRHVYLEKPIAIDDGGAGVAAALTAGAGVCAVGFNHRFHPLHQRARALLRSGALGPIAHVSVAFCEPAGDALPAWKASRATGGGALLDLGSHQVDLVRWLLDDEIAEARAERRSVRSEHDDCRLHLRTAAGVTVDAVLSFRAARCDWLHVVGERGTLLLDRYAPRLEWSLVHPRVGGVRWRHWPSRATPRVWQLHKRVFPQHEPSYAIALRAWLGALGGTPAELPSADDGWQSLRALLEAERCAS